MSEGASGPHVVAVAGAPGSGKSTLAAALQARWRTPLFEFGTFCLLPEHDGPDGGPFRWPDEEALLWRNLGAVVRGYLHAGFRRVIVTDLQDARLGQLRRAFPGRDLRLFTLTVSDDALLAARVCEPTRSSGYRDVDEARAINARILARPPLPFETRLDNTETSLDALVERIDALTR